MNIIWSFSVYTSPFIAGIMYRKGYIVAENLSIFVKVMTTFGLMYISSLCLRGFGRANNEVYQNFLKVLQHANRHMSTENKNQLVRYDFDFSYWPVEYKWNEIKR